jgi:ABC-2 type transport system ATP-binding protein
MNQLLACSGLTKDFGSKKGVFKVSLEVGAGEIVGFVGPNGAGKSTTISMIAGNVGPDAGTIEIFSKQITPQNIHTLMPKLGFLLSEPSIEEECTPRRLFTEADALLETHTDWKRLSGYLKLDLDVAVGKLSLGNKKKVGIILALMHKPDLVVLDEPTSGIDPVVVRKFGTLLREVTARGGAVLLSSHDLNEIQEICDRVIMIKEGKVIINQPIQSLLKASKRKITINNPDSVVTTLLQKRFNAVVNEAGTIVSLQTGDYEDVLKLLAAHHTFDYLVEHPTLEEMFAEYYV